MNITFLCKRLYTNRDLISDRFGRLFHFAVQLARRDHQVTVVALDYDKKRTFERHTIDAVHFLSVPVIGILKTPLGFIRTFNETHAAKPDILIASADTYLGVVAASFSRLLSTPWCFDIYDDYRYFASAKIPGMRRIFNLVTKDADSIIVASEPLKQFAEPQNPATYVIENGTDTDLFRPLNKLACRRRLGLPDDQRIIGYFGSIEKRRGIETLIKAVAMYRRKYPNVRLLIAGKSDASIDLPALNVDYRGNVPHQTVPELINACDVVTIPYEHDPYIDATNPCKISEYLACEVPIVVTSVSDMASLFSNTPSVLAEPGVAESLSRAIERQLTSPTLIALDSNLTWSALTERLDAIIRKTVQAP